MKDGSTLLLHKKSIGWRKELSRNELFIFCLLLRNAALEKRGALHVQLTEEQMFSFLKEDCQKAENAAKDVICKGGWIEKTRQDGTKYMEWSDSLVDKNAWDRLPDLVKAICADMVFNLGKGGFKNYPSFIKAIKAGDYRRAAMELLKSIDYESNIKTPTNPEPKNPGLAKRRLDAAIELTKLAEEKKRRKQ